MGASLSATGPSPSGSSPQAVSPVPASVPCAAIKGPLTDEQKALLDQALSPRKAFVPRQPQPLTLRQWIGAAVFAAVLMVMLLAFLVITPN